MDKPIFDLLSTLTLKHLIWGAVAASVLLAAATAVGALALKKLVKWVRPQSAPATSMAIESQHEPTAEEKELHDACRYVLQKAIRTQTAYMGLIVAESYPLVESRRAGLVLMERKNIELALVNMAGAMLDLADVLESRGIESGIERQAKALERIQFHTTESQQVENFTTLPLRSGGASIPSNLTASGVRS